MIAMLVAPAAAARQWTESLGAMVTLAAIIGATCAALGTVVSATTSGVPTGPVIVLTGSVIFLVSLLFAPKRGILFSQNKRSSVAIAAPNQEPRK